MYLILYYSLLAGLATLVGCLIVLSFNKINNKLLAWMLGLAAGIMLTVVIIDLIPSSYAYGNIFISLCGFISGNILLFFLDFLITGLPSLQSIASSNKGYFLKMGYLIAVGIALHDLPEGIAIAAGYSAANHLGFVIALAIGIHNIPEGMATAAPLKMSGMQRRKIIFIVFLVSLITPFGAFLGLMLLYISPVLIGFLLALAGGAMTYIVKKELWPESRRHSISYAVFGSICGAIIMVTASIIHH